MRLLPWLSRHLSVIRRKELLPPSNAFSNLGWVNVFSEYITGGWQRNLTPVLPQNVLAFSAVYACIDLIAGDVSKLRLRLMQVGTDGIWTEVDAQSTFSRVLARPNSFQTRIQFLKAWMVSKLLNGNTYILLERDEARRVRAMYVLNPAGVEPLVSNTTGDVFYRIRSDNLAGINDDEGLVVPASEIIHDRAMCPWHPLVGVSPIFAAGASAMQGSAIQTNSEGFFSNLSRPGGILTAPGRITPETAERLKATFDTRFAGENMGKVFVAGDGLTFNPIAMPAQTAQLIEQLKFTVTDVARPFHVPPYKLGENSNVTFSNAAQLNQDYYQQCLQEHLFGIQALLWEGLGLPTNYRAWFDLDDLLILDAAGRADADQKDITSGLLAPNEGRAKRNLRPVEGGDQPFMQQQMWQIGQLADRAPPSDAPMLPPPAKMIDEDALAAKVAEAVRAKTAEADDKVVDFRALLRERARQREVADAA